MNARRTLTAAACVLAIAAGGACSGGGSPTLTEFTNDPTPPVAPAPPTDTIGFVPEPGTLGP